MKDVSKWEVIWSRGEPFIIFRDNRLFKIFKVKVEDEFFVIEAIKSKEGGFASKTSIKNFLLQKFELDGSAVDQVIMLYREFYNELGSLW